MVAYTVRQYRPAFVSGFENAVVEHVNEKDLMNPAVCPWLKNFQHEGFVEFYIDNPHYKDGQLFISARYEDGKHWVASLAYPETTAMAA